MPHDNSRIRAIVAHDIQQFRQQVQSHPFQMLEKGFSDAHTNAMSTRNVDDGQQQALQLGRDSVNPMSSHNIKPFQVATQPPIQRQWDSDIQWREECNQQRSNDQVWLHDASKDRACQQWWVPIRQKLQ